MAKGVNKIHIHNKQDVKVLSRFVLDYSHMLNMVKILFNETYKKRHFHITNIMQNANALRAICCNQAGGQLRDQITMVKEYFKDEPLFHSIQAHYQQRCNEKNLYYVFKDFVKDVKNQITEKTYSFPKSKKIHKINYFAFTLDKSKYEIKKEQHLLVLKLGKTSDHRDIHLNYNNLAKHVLDNLESIKICYILGHIEIHFVYEEKMKDEVRKAVAKKVKKQPKKYAGLDLGLNNTFTLFIGDKDTPSISFEGHELIKYNCDYNYNIAKTQRLLYDNAVIDFLETEKGGQVPIFSNYATHFKKAIKNLNYYRGNYYEDVFQKMSKQVLEYCYRHGVTDLAISTNLSFAKVKGEIKMKKKTQQKFYQIPFGELLRYLKLKAVDFGITLHDINEAYTSKTSPLKNIVEVIAQAKTLKIHNDLNQENKKLSSTVYGGIREGSIFYVNGKGKKCTVQYHADCVGAYNHYRLITDKWCSPDEIESHKLTTPVVIKSTEDFTNHLRYLQCGSGS